MKPGRLIRLLVRLLEHDIADLRAHIAAVDERAAAREQMNANNLADLTADVDRLAKVVGDIIGRER